MLFIMLKYSLSELLMRIEMTTTMINLWKKVRIKNPIHNIFK